VDLIEIRDTNKGEDVVAFMDDMLLLARSKTLLETNTKVKNMMIRLGGGLEWAVTHQSEFSINKFGIMGFTRR